MNSVDKNGNVSWKLSKNFTNERIYFWVYPWYIYPISFVLEKTLMMKQTYYDRDMRQCLYTKQALFHLFKEHFSIKLFTL